MNTLDLISNIAQKNDLTLGRAEMILSIIIERIMEKIKVGDSVNIPGFGTFKVVSQASDSTYSYLNKAASSRRFYISFVPDAKFLDIINS
jgi:DNA-binding protein